MPQEEKRERIGGTSAISEKPTVKKKGLDNSLHTTELGENPPKASEALFQKSTKRICKRKHEVKHKQKGQAKYIKGDQGVLGFNNPKIRWVGKRTSQIQKGGRTSN